MEVDSLYGDEFEFPLYDFDSGISSPGDLSDSSSFSPGSPDLLLDDDEAIKIGKSILEGRPIYNPFIQVKMEAEDKCCSCYCHASSWKTTEENTSIKDTWTALNLFDHSDNSVEFLNKSAITNEINSDLQDILMETSVLDLTMEDDSTVDVETEQPTVSPIKQNAQISGDLGYDREKNNKADHTYCRNGEIEDDDDDANDETYQPTLKKKQRPASDPKINKEKKDKRYLEKRMKNNIAAKRSREAKRQREMEVLKKTMSLEKENVDLNKQVLKMKKLIAKLETKLT